MKQPCIDCGHPTAGTRCDRCTAQRYGGHNPYGAAYRRAAKTVRATTRTCWLCGKGPKPNDPWQADHVTPVAAGGARGGLNSELRGAHRSCNIARSNRTQ